MMTSIDKSKVLVLVVDDEEALCEMIKAHGSFVGFNVTTAGSVDEAIKICEDNRDKVIAGIFDIHLPGDKDGMDLLQHTKRHFPNVAAFAMTQDEDITVRSEAMAAGAIFTFPKLVTNNLFIKAPVISEVLLAIPTAVEFVISSSFDHLTGLWNRKTLFGKFIVPYLQAAKNRQSPEYCSLLSIDLDDLKAVNDAYGHPMGDRAIVKVGEVLRTNVRPLDQVCHVSGDEFLVFLAYTDPLQAQSSAEHLRVSVSNSYVEGEKGEIVSLAISIGVGTMHWKEVANLAQPEHVLTERADEAMYRDKELKDVRRR